MVKKLRKVAKALGKASKLHKKQSNIIKKAYKGDETWQILK